MEEAELESHKLLADAQTEAQRRGEEERVRLEDEVVDLAARRDTLLADVDALTTLRARLPRTCRGRARSRPRRGTQPHHRCARADARDPSVELPVARRSASRSEAIEARDRPSPWLPSRSSLRRQHDGDTAGRSRSNSCGRRDATGRDVAPTGEVRRRRRLPLRARMVRTASSSGIGERRDDDAASRRSVHRRVEPSTRRPPHPDDAAATSPADAGPATREVDVTALFDAEAAEPVAAAPSPAPTVRQRPRHAPRRRLGLARSGRHADTGLNVDPLRHRRARHRVLDDDAFFATLREAVTMKHRSARDDDAIGRGRLLRRRRRSHIVPRRLPPPPLNAAACGPRL